MKEFTEKDMLDFVEYYDNLPENEQIAYDFVLPDFLENRKNNDIKQTVSESLKSPLNETGLAFNSFQVRVIAIDIHDRFICVNSIGEIMALHKEHVKFKAF